jgi:hypothetical protein
MSDEIEAQISSSRDELAKTLDAIEDKLNVPKLVGRLRVRAERLGTNAVDSYHANPIPWIAGATATVIAIGGVVAWAILSEDD